MSIRDESAVRPLADVRCILLQSTCIHVCCEALPSALCVRLGRWVLDARHYAPGAAVSGAPASKQRLETPIHDRGRGTTDCRLGNRK